MNPKIEYQNRNPEKVQAHRKVKYALKVGSMVRPKACSKCGLSGGRIEGHHADYAKPLDVEWLCVPCHNMAHMEMSRGPHWKAVLDEKAVREIRRLHSEGLGARKLGKMFGVDPTTAGRIFRREMWKHVV